MVTRIMRQVVRMRRTVGLALGAALALGALAIPASSATATAAPGATTSVPAPSQMQATTVRMLVPTATPRPGSTVCDPLPIAGPQTGVRTRVCISITRRQTYIYSVQGQIQLWNTSFWGFFSVTSSTNAFHYRVSAFQYFQAPWWKVNWIGFKYTINTGVPNGSTVHLTLWKFTGYDAHKHPVYAILRDLPISIWRMRL